MKRWFSFTLELYIDMAEVMRSDAIIIWESKEIYIRKEGWYGGAYSGNGMVSNKPLAVLLELFYLEFPKLQTG